MAGQKNKGLALPSTGQDRLPTPEKQGNKFPENGGTLFPATRSEIYKRALSAFRVAFPQYDAITYLASRMNMSANSLYAKIEDSERHFTVFEEELFARMCYYPALFTLKAQWVFRMEDMP